MKLTISKKLSVGFGISVIAIISLSLLSYLGAHRISERAVETAHTLEVRHALSKAELEYVIWVDNLQNGLLHDHIDESKVELDKRASKFGQWFYGEGRRKAEEYAPYLRETLAELEEPHTKLYGSANEIHRLLQANDRASAQQHFDAHLEPNIAKMISLFEDMISAVDATHTGEAEMLESAQENESQVITLGIVGGTLSIILIIAAVLLVRNITDILGEALNAIASSSSQISATSEEHEKILAQQASSVNETTATMDELDAAARLSTEHANSASALVQDAVGNAQNGEQMVDQMTESMTDLRSKVDAIGQQILRLSEKTSQIDNIVNAVSELANQTNMLALNAAVEAAHAGEQGKGFAVVAKEIRKLADQSKKSAERIATLISEVQEVTSSTVMVAEDGATTLDDTVRRVNEAGGSFGDLAGSVGTISENVQQIALSAKQQAAAIEQVVVAMGSINEGAKQSGVGLRQTREGVEQMLVLANNIRSQV